MFLARLTVKQKTGVELKVLMTARATITNTNKTTTTTDLDQTQEAMMREGRSQSRERRRAEAEMHTPGPGGAGGRLSEEAHRAAAEDRKPWTGQRQRRKSELGGGWMLCNKIRPTAEIPPS